MAHQRSQSVALRMQSLKSKKDVIEEAWQTKKKCHHIVVVIIVVIVVVLAQRSFVALWLPVGALVQFVPVVARGRLG